MAGLSLLARVAQAQGQPARAARLLGTARSVATSVGLGDLGPVALDPYDPLGFEQLVEDVRAALGADRFAAAWAEGEGAPWEEAVTTALATS